MQAIKKIVKTDVAEITIKIPEEFKGKEIEIIILPFGNTETNLLELTKKERLGKLFATSVGVMPSAYKFDREEAHER